jgi:hypothetical protein
MLEVHGTAALRAHGLAENPVAPPLGHAPPAIRKLAPEDVEKARDSDGRVVAVPGTGLTDVHEGAFAENRRLLQVGRKSRERLPGRSWGERDRRNDVS